MHKLLNLLKQHSLLSIFIAVSFFIRVKLLAWWNPFPFGDVFNYVAIAQNLAHGTYPIADKRLPFYPFLILVGHTLLPWLTWETIAIWVALFASVLALIFLYAIGRKLGFKKEGIILSLLIYSAFQPFLTYSIRGYADTTFTALLAAAILLTLYIKEKHWAFAVLGITLAALMLTRYEGVPAAGIIFCFASAKLLPKDWRKILLMIAIILISLLPYVVIAKHAHRDLLPTTYLTQAASEDQGYGAEDFGEFKNRYWGMWSRLGLFDFYERPKILYGELKDNPWGFHAQLTDVLTNPRTVAGMIGSLGIIVLAMRRRFNTLGLITLPYLATAVPIAWWAAFIRYDAMIFPLMILCSMAGFSWIIETLEKNLVFQSKKIVYLGYALIIFIGFGIWLWGMVQDTQNTLVKSRFRDQAYYQAIQAAQKVSGNILFEHKQGIVYVYFPNRSFFTEDVFPKNISTQDKWQVLERNNIHHLLISSRDEKSMTFLSDPPSSAQVDLVGSWEVEEGTGEITHAQLIQLAF